MKRIYFAALALAVVALPSVAQETYENAKLITEDLNGTARYVGMGGALEALGADISTIGSNPAGIGVLRSSNVSLSFGINTQEGAADFNNANKTRWSFDQAGFVYSTNEDDESYVNIGFNYHKSRNFDYILSAADGLRYASQNKLTYAKAKNGLLFEVKNDGSPDPNQSYASCSQLDYMYADYLNYDAPTNIWYYDEATDYTLDRHHKGYIGEYDINLSGSINNRVFLGLTLGVHDVHYKHYGEYREHLTNNSNILVADDREITGNGYNVKAGIIFRPIEYSPFRVGMYVNTPTWYSLETWNSTTIDMRGGSYTFQTGSSESYKFKLYTPWKFGLSLGHTIGTQLALGLTYEYASYGSTDTRYNTEGYYDSWDNYHSSRSDDIMNRHTDQTLKGVSTLKAGLEFKPTPEFAVRLGYNYVSPMYNKDGFKDGTLQTDGSYYSSATDFTNWDSTNRITCGLGYTIDDLNFSLAYQYTTTKGKFMPFMTYMDDTTPADDINVNEVDVNNKRHQVLFTVGYTF
jgi:hypothetical protein